MCLGWGNFVSLGGGHLYRLGGGTFVSLGEETLVSIDAGDICLLRRNLYNPSPKKSRPIGLI